MRTSQQLIQTTLYATGYETREGGYADYIVYHADTAIYELAAYTREHGFTDIEPLLREALHAPDVSPPVGGKLLVGLKAWSLPLIEEWITHPEARMRAIAVHAAGDTLAPARWLPTLEDPDPLVRVAALQTVIAHWFDLPNAKALVDKALADPQYQVRLAAMQSINSYQDEQRNEMIAQLVEGETNPELRRSTLSWLIKAASDAVWSSERQLYEYKLLPAMKRVLLSELSSDDPALRRQVAWVLRHYYDQEVAEALFERLLVETEPEVLSALLHGIYRPIAEKVVPHVHALRNRLIFPALGSLPLFLEQFGEVGLPLLFELLADPQTRSQAAHSLGRMGKKKSLSALQHARAATSDFNQLRVIDEAIQQITRFGS
jgi:HEAT repeat protein